MMKKVYISLLLICSISLFGYAGSDDDPAKIRFSFNSEREFKIAQFTDLHWSDTSPGCAEVETTIKRVLEAEKPDLAVLTGDVVTQSPAEEGWKSVIRIFEEAKLPFAVVLGNHEGETEMSKAEMFRLLATSPLFVGEAGPAEINGYGNYILPIYDSAGKKKETALLYFLDSNDYPADKTRGKYDWIHYDQIHWYRQQSQTHTLRNNGKPLPALAFFHIPLPEYNNIIGKETTVGIQGEKVCSPQLNSGLLFSIVEMGDVMGTFVGHDHNNDYIGVEQGIALAYGRKTGRDTYGSLELGARIIVLHENEFRFDTWICTPERREQIFHHNR